MSRLVIYEGEEQRAEHELAHAVVGLGRHPQNDIVLDDRTLSRFHARIEKRDRGFVVIDLGAQNGVHLNGERIDKEAALQSGDRIDLGRYTAVFHERARPRSAVRPTAAAPQALPTPVSPLPGVGRPSSAKMKAAEKPPVPADDDLDLDIDMDGDLDGDLVGELDPEHDFGATHNDPARGGFNEPSQVEYTAPQPTLVLLFNGMEVSRHPYNEPGLIVGRSKQCDVVISLLGLSRRHSRIFATDEGIAVEDLGSQNGTWVNNERIDGARVLRHGDLLNFYDYGVLFLEDGDVEVGFPGPGFVPPPTTGNGNDHDHELSARATNRSAAAVAPVARPSRPPTPRSPLADDDLFDETAMGRGRPHRKRNDDVLNLDDLGDGSYLGDEFDDGASKVRDKGRELQAPAAGMGTDLIEQMQLSRGDADEDLEAEIAFSSSAHPDDFVDSGTNGEAAELGDRTTTGFDVAAALGGAWPNDDELERALMVMADPGLLSLEVTLRGKPYTQIPLTQPVMRVGSDPRCEVSMPRTAGLRSWHLTLSQIGSAVLCVRSNRAAVVEVDGREIDATVLHGGETIKVGKVELKLRIR